MIDSTPRKCCAEGFKWTGESTGKYTEIAGYNAYITGNDSSKNLLFYCTDIYGIQFTNARLIADNFAKAGYLVVAIDFFNNDSFTAGGDLAAWLKEHSPASSFPVADKTLAQVKEQYKPDFVAAVGYCYGGTVVAHLQGSSSVDVAAWAHPSFVTEEQLNALKVPVHISLAEHDQVLSDEARNKMLDILRANKLRYNVTIYSGTTHGFAARGDKNDPIVQEAMEKVVSEQLYFFDLIRAS